MFAKRMITHFALAIAFAITASAAYAQTYTVESGKTSVALSSDFVAALHTLKLTPGVLSPTTIASGQATFPAVAGAVNLNNLRGQILHSGGLTLANAKVRVRLQSYIIDTTGAKPVITGLVTVNGKLIGRLPLFDLQVPAGIKFPLMPNEAGGLWLKGVGVTLDSTAANALNSVYGVSAFHGGFDIGTANVYIMVRADNGN